MYSKNIDTRIEYRKQLIENLTADQVAECFKHDTLVAKKAASIESGDFKTAIALEKDIRESQLILGVMQEQLTQAEQAQPVTIDLMLTEWATHRHPALSKIEKQAAATEKALKNYIEELNKLSQVNNDARTEAKKWDALASEIKSVKNGMRMEYFSYDRAVKTGVKNLYTEYGKNLE